MFRLFSAVSKTHSCIRIHHLARLSYHAPFASTRPMNPIKPERELPIQQPPSPSILIKRALKYSSFGLFIVGLTVASAYWGFQLYAEHVGMAPETDPEIHKWEWNFIEIQWSGDPALGGTDSALDSRARRLIHAAWQAYTYGIGYDIVAVEDAPSGEPDQTGVVYGIDARLHRTEVLLRQAIKLAEVSKTHGKLLPNTIPILLLRHASVLEQLGDQYLLLCKQEYERAWQSFTDEGPYRGYISLKLGDLSARLGLENEAFEWWNRSSRLVQEGSGTSTKPLTIPPSPFAQRIYFSGLVSQSACLAATGKFKEAELIQRTALELLRSITPQSTDSTSYPQALHALFLLHRSSLLSIHFAETSFARHRPIHSSIQSLSTAAESAERVACLLTGTPRDKEHPLIQPQDNPLLSIYAESRSMNRPASALLRDARRTAAEAWNLLGILYEGQEGPTSQKAFDCFKRAVDWAGKHSPDGGDISPNNAILDSDWSIYWRNYQRVQSAVKRSARN